MACPSSCAIVATSRAVGHAGHFVVTGRYIDRRQRRVGAAAYLLQVGQLILVHHHVFAVPPLNTGTAQTVLQRRLQRIDLLLAHEASRKMQECDVRGARATGQQQNVGRTAGGAGESLVGASIASTRQEKNMCGKILFTLLTHSPRRIQHALGASSLCIGPDIRA